MNEVIMPCCQAIIVPVIVLVCGRAAKYAAYQVSIVCNKPFQNRNRNQCSVFSVAYRKTCSSCLR